MRHGKKVNHLGRKSAHRHALLSNMASSLILNKRITTTVAKAKALRKYVEPLLTKSKDNTTHSRRTVFAYLQNKESIKALFGEVAGRIANRPGGYTRIIKLGEVRLGDAADMCMMELVDFNDIYKKDGVEKKTKTRRSRTKKSEGVVEDAKVEGEVKETKEKQKKATKKSKKDE
jgi:large subunit ribosomal protein L17